MEKTEIGEITHYYDKVGVAVVKLTAELNQGDKIAIEGSTTKFDQTADSMQIERDPIEKADAGQEVGLKVNDTVRRGDKVYKLAE